MTREQAWDAFNDIPEDVKNAIYLIVGYVNDCMNNGTMTRDRELVIRIILSDMWKQNLGRNYTL